MVWGSVSSVVVLFFLLFFNMVISIGCCPARALWHYWDLWLEKFLLIVLPLLLRRHTAGWRFWNVFCISLQLQKWYSKMRCPMFFMEFSNGKVFFAGMFSRGMFSCSMPVCLCFVDIHNCNYVHACKRFAVGKYFCRNLSQLFAANYKNDPRNRNIYQLCVVLIPS